MVSLQLTTLVILWKRSKSDSRETFGEQCYLMHDMAKK